MTDKDILQWMLSRAANSVVRARQWHYDGNNANAIQWIRRARGLLDAVEHELTTGIGGPEIPQIVITELMEEDNDDRNEETQPNPPNTAPHREGGSEDS